MINNYNCNNIINMNCIIISIVSIIIIGSIVWSHHMYTIGLYNDNKCYYNIITLLISIPTINKISTYSNTKLPKLH
jgi:cytochrome c oxidase subunit 1